MYYDFYRRKRRRGRPRGRRAHYYNRNHLTKVKGQKLKQQIGDKKRKKRKDRWPNPGYRNVQNPLRVSPSLAAIINTNEATRGQIVHRVWAYIKANKLQITGQGRWIVPDKTLATVMGVEGKPMNGFTMMRFIKNHIQKPGGSLAEPSSKEVKDPEGSPMALGSQEDQPGPEVPEDQPVASKDSSSPDVKRD